MAAILKKIEKLYESKLCREWSRLDEIRQADAKSYGKKTANIIVKKLNSLQLCILHVLFRLRNDTGSATAFIQSHCS